MPFNIGDRVLARIPETGLIPDPDRLQARGTVVEKPGGLVYNVRLDEPMIAPDGSTYDVITDLGDITYRIVCVGQVLKCLGVPVIA